VRVAILGYFGDIKRWGGGYKDVKRQGKGGKDGANKGKRALEDAGKCFCWGVLHCLPLLPPLHPSPQNTPPLIL
jgi:hypothetical protein